jgi:hypothetical protein
MPKKSRREIYVLCLIGTANPMFFLPAELLMEIAKHFNRSVFIASWTKQKIFYWPEIAYVYHPISEKIDIDTRFPNCIKTIPVRFDGTDKSLVIQDPMYPRGIYPTVTHLVTGVTKNLSKTHPSLINLEIMGKPHTVKVHHPTIENIRCVLQGSCVLDVKCERLHILDAVNNNFHDVKVVAPRVRDINIQGNPLTDVYLDCPTLELLKCFGTNGKMKPIKLNCKDTVTIRADKYADITFIDPVKVKQEEIKAQLKKEKQEMISQLRIESMHTKAKLVALEEQIKRLQTDLLIATREIAAMKKVI